MRHLIFLLLIALVASGTTLCLADESGNALFETFNEAFQAKVPRPYSSVNTDYKMDQIALGTYYSTKTLSLIYAQNQEILTKYDEMIARYDQIILQNQKIIELLKAFVRQVPQKNSEK